MAEVTEPAELSVVHELRRAVFVLEQGVSEAEEWDGLDGECRHWLAWAEDRAVGTARLRVTGDVACVQRVAVAADWRRRGVGRALMAAVEDAARAAGCTRVQLGAQLTALAFYHRLGYSAHGPVFDDAGIPHRAMVKVWEAEL